ncbi:hypothetical protein ABZV14_09685 [Streptosporangium canum]
MTRASGEYRRSAPAAGVPKARLDALLGDRASSATGTGLPVDGGMVAVRG